MASEIEGVHLISYDAYDVISCICVSWEERNNAWTLEFDCLWGIKLWLFEHLDSKLIAAAENRLFFEVGIMFMVILAAKTTTPIMALIERSSVGLVRPGCICSTDTSIYYLLLFSFH